MPNGPTCARNTRYASAPASLHTPRSQWRAVEERLFSQDMWSIAEPAHIGGGRKSSPSFRLDSVRHQAQIFRRNFDFGVPVDFASRRPHRVADHVRDFVRSELQPHDRSIEDTGVVPEQAMAGLRRTGTVRLQPLGRASVDWVCRCWAVAWPSRSRQGAHRPLTYLSGVNVHIGSKAIEFYAAPALRQQWLPQLASGQVIGAFALTEPDAGSDAAGIKPARHAMARRTMCSTA